MNRLAKNWIFLLALPGVLFLAIDPVLWLVDTWLDPSWDSQGLWVALAVALLILRSASSGPAAADRNERRLALGLLAMTALLRLGGRLLAIRGLGALALVADLAAVGLLLGLNRRPWPLSPWAVAGLFCLSLPVEMWLQRILGYPLRAASAFVAHAALQPAFPGLRLEGTLLVSEASSLAVDLPCSGAQGLMLLSGMTLFLLCRRRIGARGWLLLGLLLPAAAILANALRILLLFLGQQAGLDIFAEPLHSAIGLLALTAGALLILLPLTRLPLRVPAPIETRPVPHAIRPSLRRAAAALGFTAVAALVSSAPAHPVDVSGQVPTRTLPVRLAGWQGRDLPLNPVEERYYRRYGGQALKRLYTDPRFGGRQILILVRTRSPLRHLHGPERCLAGAGFEVQRLGVLTGQPPSVRWRATDPQGETWEVLGSFLDPEGRGASSLAELVWRWLGGQRGEWILAERIRPEGLCQSRPALCRAFDQSLFAALDAAALEESP